MLNMEIIVEIFSVMAFYLHLDGKWARPMALNLIGPTQPTDGADLAWAFFRKGRSGDLWARPLRPVRPSLPGLPQLNQGI